MNMNNRCMILETLNEVTVLESRRGTDGLMRLSGVFGVCGIKNNNGRIYETKNYEAMVQEIQRRIKAKGVPGELEHPNNMNITLENISHKIETINIDEKGVVTGTIVLLDTPKGKLAQSIIEGGLPLYISSRGSGNVGQNGRVVLERIETYDLVGTPGFSEARLELDSHYKFESLNESCCVIVDTTEVYETEKEEIKENKNKDMSEITKLEVDRIVERLNNLEVENIELRSIVESYKDKAEDESGITVESVQDIVTNLFVTHFAPAIQEWIVEEYSPEIQDWIVEEYSPEIQDWIVEEYSPEIQDWIVEEYSPVINEWVETEFKPNILEHTEDSIKESRANKLQSIDDMLTLLESRDVAKPVIEKPQPQAITEGMSFLQDMPDQYKPLWNMTTQEIKESIISKAKLYDFTKEGVLESFWSKVEFNKSPETTFINEQKVITFEPREQSIRESLRNSAFRFGIRK